MQPDKDRSLAAAAAFKNVEVTGQAYLDHPKACWICRVPFLRRLVPCPKWKRLMAAFVKAHADSVPYRIEVLGDAETPTPEWLENLYRL